MVAKAPSGPSGNHPRCYSRASACTRSRRARPSVFLAKIWSLHMGFITSTRVLGLSTGTMFLARRGQSHAHQPGVPLRIPCSGSQCVSSLRIPRESVDSAHAIRKDPGLGGRCHGSDHGWAWHGDHPWSPAWCASPHSSMPTLSCRVHLDLC